MMDVVMKKLIIMALMLLFLSSAEAMAKEKENAMNITLKVGDTVIPAALNDTVAARDLLSRLPCTVTLNRGSVDFCGDIGKPLRYAADDFRHGWEYGDFMWMPNGNWFVIFFDGKETYGKKDWLVLGHMGPQWQSLKEMQGSIEITIDRVGDQDMGK